MKSRLAIFSLGIRVGWLTAFVPPASLESVRGEPLTLRHLAADPTPDVLESGQPWMAVGRGSASTTKPQVMQVPRGLWDVNVFSAAPFNTDAKIFGTTALAEIGEDSKTSSWTLTFKPVLPCGSGALTTAIDYSFMAVASGWYNTTSSTILVGNVDVPAGQTATVQLSHKWHKGTLFSKAPSIIAQYQRNDFHITPYISAVTATSFKLQWVFNSKTGTAPRNARFSWMALTQPGAMILPNALLYATQGVKDATRVLYNAKLPQETGLTPACGGPLLFASPVALAATTTPTMTSYTSGATSNIGGELTASTCNCSTSACNNVEIVPSVLIYIPSSCTAVSGGDIPLSPTDVAAGKGKSVSAKVTKSQLAYVLAGGLACVFLVAGLAWGLCTLMKKKDDGSPPPYPGAGYPGMQGGMGMGGGGMPGMGGPPGFGGPRPPPGFGGRPQGPGWYG